MTVAAASGDTQSPDQLNDVTEEMIEHLRTENAELQTKIGEANTRRAQREARHARQIEYGQLLAENVRLRNELASAEAAAEATQVAAGAGALLDTIKDNLATAVEQSKAPIGPVDTNSGFVESPEKLPSAQDAANAEAAEKADALSDQPADALTPPVPGGVTEDGTSPTATTPTGVDPDAPAVQVPDATTDVPSDAPAGVEEFLNGDVPSGDEPVETDTTTNESGVESGQNEE